MSFKTKQVIERSMPSNMLNMLWQILKADWKICFKMDRYSYVTQVIIMWDKPPPYSQTTATPAAACSILCSHEAHHLIFGEYTMIGCLILSTLKYVLVSVCHTNRVTWCHLWSLWTNNDKQDDAGDQWSLIAQPRWWSRASSRCATMMNRSCMLRWEKSRPPGHSKESIPI